jgi:tRNA modification GTPase
VSGLRLLELTPVGTGAVSILALEGPGAVALAETWSGRRLEPDSLTLARLTVGGEEIDEVLLLVLAEDRVEIHLHGSPLLVELLRSRVDGTETSPETAERGLEERAEAALARAPSEAGARILLDQAEGALRRSLEALIAADEEELFTGLEVLEEGSRIARFALEPTRLVLAGEANSGKSTLFNVLVSRERVITSPEAGTTRDTVAEAALLGEWPVILIDTAGERSAEGSPLVSPVEKEARNLAERAMGAADLLLWLRAPGAASPPPTHHSGRRVAFGSKCDLPGGDPRGISATRDPRGARVAVERAFQESLGLPETVWKPGRGLAFDRLTREVVAAARHVEAEAAREKLCHLLEGGGVERC